MTASPTAGRGGRHLRVVGRDRVDFDHGCHGDVECASAVSPGSGWTPAPKYADYGDGAGAFEGTMMNEISPDNVGFVGRGPQMYEQLLVPLLFEEPARSMARLIAGFAPADVLETAAGTGALTRALLASTEARITATDLNPPMLEEAQSRVVDPRVSWQVADALELPFPDASFDVVTCQFGAMFFPDRVRGYREARRVLRPDGAFVFTVWDTLETNPASATVTTALQQVAAEGEFSFLARTPHGHAQDDVLRTELREAGFSDVRIARVGARSPTNVHDAAQALCRGTGLGPEIEAHSSITMAQAVALTEAALRERFGAEQFDAPIQWVEIVAR